MSSGWAGRRVDGKTHMFRTIFFYRIFQLCQIHLFLHDFCDGKMSADLPFWKNLCPAWSGSWILACKSCAQASRIVRVASLPCRRRRSPIIFRWKNTGVFEHCIFLHFCKFVCCWVHIAILMRRRCCFGGGVFNISKTLPIWWPM